MNGEAILFDDLKIKELIGKVRKYYYKNFYRYSLINRYFYMTQKTKRAIIKNFVNNLLGKNKSIVINNSTLDKKAIKQAAKEFKEQNKWVKSLSKKNREVLKGLKEEVSGFLKQFIKDKDTDMIADAIVTVVIQTWEEK